MSHIDILESPQVKSRISLGHLRLGPIANPRPRDQELPERQVSRGYSARAFRFSDACLTAVGAAATVGLASFLTAGFAAGQLLIASPGAYGPPYPECCGGFFVWSLVLVGSGWNRPGVRPRPAPGEGRGAGPGDSTS